MTSMRASESGVASSAHHQYAMRDGDGIPDEHRERLEQHGIDSLKPFTRRSSPGNRMARAGIHTPFGTRGHCMLSSIGPVFLARLTSIKCRRWFGDTELQ